MVLWQFALISPIYSRNWVNLFTELFAIHSITIVKHGLFVGCQGAGFGFDGLSVSGSHFWRSGDKSYVYFPQHIWSPPLKRWCHGCFVPDYLDFNSFGLGEICSHCFVGKRQWRRWTWKYLFNDSTLVYSPFFLHWLVSIFACEFKKQT